MGPKDREERTLQLVQQHAAELLRFARRFSHCADDAHDAYQRSLEILVRRMRTDPPAEPLKWVRSVLRHEAYAVRRERERHVSRDEIDFDRHENRQADDPAERAASAERLTAVAEALQRLKPQEVTALVLRAEGLSYKEICARQGWTWTKTNRCVTEGRRALRDRLEAIESGAECDRWLSHLSALADGEATADQRTAVRPHLASCAACRATLRGFHDAPRQVAALVPVAAVPVASGADPGALMAPVMAMVHAVSERATFAVTRLQGAFDALPTAKVAAVAASTAAIAGGGAAVERAVDAAPVRAEPVVQSVAPADVPATVPVPPPSPSVVEPAPATTTPDTAAPAGEFAAESAPEPEPVPPPRTEPTPTGPSEFAGPF